MVNVRPKNLWGKDKIIFPLDVPNIQEAWKAVDLLGPYVGPFKAGLELIYSTIAQAIVGDEECAFSALKLARNLAHKIGPNLFLDVKLADIPNTVGKASLAISRLGVKYFNVHASAGIPAIKAAVENKGQSGVLVVTVLTSLNAEQCKSIFGDEPEHKVSDFAAMILEAGADGVICSPKELKLLRANANFDDLTIVTPGVRPEWAPADDQKRVMTPGEAIKAGADYLVIGRPIAKAKDPVEAAKRIADEIDKALISQMHLD